MRFIGVKATTIERILRILVLWIIFFMIYLGVAIPPSEVRGEVALKAAIVTLIVAIALSEFLAFNPRKLLDPRRIRLFITLCLRYVIAEVESHIRVTKIILNPRSRVTAAIMPASIHGSENVLVTLAHLITNTPGTVAIDFESTGSGGILYIHWLNPDTLDEVKAKDIIIGWMERHVRELVD